MSSRKDMLVELESLKSVELESLKSVGPMSLSGLSCFGAGNDTCAACSALVHTVQSSGMLAIGVKKRWCASI